MFHLTQRFNKINGLQGEVRDIGKLAEERTKAVERIINKGTGPMHNVVLKLQWAVH